MQKDPLKRLKEILSREEIEKLGGKCAPYGARAFGSGACCAGA